MTLAPDKVIPKRAPCIIRKPSLTGPHKDVNDMMLLLRIFSWMRPHDSDAEQQFVHDYIDSIGATADEFGNRHLRIGTAPIAFSCHVDTMHHKGGYQKLDIFPDDKGSHNIGVQRGTGNCLGADDGTGIFIMLNMIAARKPGLYLFHRGEERGCIGSRYISTKEKNLLCGINQAVAFDRRGFDSVITHQRSRRTCSETFAKDLATKLGGDFKPDDTGLYTDTAEYTSLVSECTNLSVGYFNQHGPTETQNIAFVRDLVAKVISIDWSNLPHERDPSKPSETKYATNYSGGYNQGHHNQPNYYGHANSNTKWSGYDKKSIYQLINAESYLVSRFLIDSGVSEAQLLAYIKGDKLQVRPLSHEPTPAASAATTTTNPAHSSKAFTPGFDTEEIENPYGYHE